jgi:hypothetical protein
MSYEYNALDREKRQEIPLYPSENAKSTGFPEKTGVMQRVGIIMMMIMMLLLVL